MADSAGLVQQEVFTADQAAVVLGLARNSVIDLARRRRDNGRPVSWDRDDTENPFPVVLVLASWVVELAADRHGLQADTPPSKVYLPPLPGVAVVADGELTSRLEQSELLVDAYRREALEERMARLSLVAEKAESERDAERARRLMAEAEVERLRQAMVVLNGGTPAVATLRS
ncbi:MAG: hypothetical protein ACYCXY_11455 [Acidimicrobiales bacterium]